MCISSQRLTQGIDKSQVRGIGFDATCSLVVLDRNFQPVPVNKDGRWPSHGALPWDPSTENMKGSEEELYKGS